MRFNNFIHVGQRDASVPYCVGIYDYIGSVLTLIETSGLISSDFSLQATLGQLALKKFLQFSSAGWITTAARIAWRPHISADKNMAFKLRHLNMLQDRERAAEASWKK
jgi:hypothetical protein